jgi:hypothetical protein
MVFLDPAKGFDAPHGSECGTLRLLLYCIPLGHSHYVLWVCDLPWSDAALTVVVFSRREVDVPLLIKLRCFYFKKQQHSI